MDTPGLLRYTLRIEPLTPEGFMSFGEVIDANRPRVSTTINQGYAERFGDLARVDTSHADGRPIVSIYRTRPITLPFRLRLLERHRLGSQTFMPLNNQSFLVIVAPAAAQAKLDELRVFCTSPGQGVNLARGVWHHPLVAPEPGDFLVIERAAPDLRADCDEQLLSTAQVWVTP